MRTVFIVLIAVFILWLFFSALLLNAYLSRRSNEKQSNENRTDDEEALSHDQAVDADQPQNQDELETQAATANEEKPKELAATPTSPSSEFANADQNSHDIATPFEEPSTTETDTVIEELDAEKEKVAVATGTEKPNETTVDDTHSTAGKNAGRRVGDLPDQDVSPISAEAQEAAPASAHSGDADSDGIETVNHPDVEETACATVDKNTKRRGSKKRRRNKSKRAQVKPAASSAAAVSGAEKAKPVDNKTNETKSTNDDADSATTIAETADTAETAEETSDSSKVTIATLLADINLPYDLRSMSEDEPDVDKHTIFVSSHKDPADVGTAFADELERVGFEIEPAGVDEAIAKRDGYTLTMRITPDAGSTDRYPSLGKNDIAIETWIL